MIRVFNCEQIRPTKKGEAPVLRVTYSTDEEDDLSADLPMKWEPDDFEQGLPGDWVPDTTNFTAFQNKLWDAVGDAACAAEEQRYERLMDR